MPVEFWFIPAALFLVLAYVWAVVMPPVSLTPGLRLAAYAISASYVLLGVTSTLLASGVFGH